MSPLLHFQHRAGHLSIRVVTKPVDPNGLILEAWAQGFLVGSLIILAFITLANMRRGVLLHKLILLEVYDVFHSIRLSDAVDVTAG